MTKTAAEFEAAESIGALASLQLNWGGVFDSRSDDDLMHLVRMKRGGRTPGATLCGFDRFTKDGPGFSVGGGVSMKDGGTWPACPGCVEVADHDFAGLPVWGSFSESFPGRDRLWDNRTIMPARATDALKEAGPRTVPDVNGEALTAERTRLRVGVNVLLHRQLELRDKTNHADTRMTCNVAIEDLQKVLTLIGE